jgi:hypothetical protein
VPSKPRPAETSPRPTRPGRDREVTDMMDSRSNTNVAQAIRLMQVIQGAFIASVFIYGVVLTLIVSPGTADPQTLQVLSYALPAVWVAALGAWWGLLQPQLTRQGRGMAPDMALARYRTVVLIGNAFFESGAIYGLLLGILGAGTQHFYAMGGAAVILMVLTLPSVERFEAFVQRTQQG